MRSSIRSLALVLLASALGGSVAADAPFGIDVRSKAARLSFPFETVRSGEVAIERVFPRLSFVQPVLITQAPGDASRFFVLSQLGRMLTFANVPDPASSSVFLDLSTRVNPDGEQGLLGLAFDPDYASNGHFYVYYSGAGTPRRSVISRFTANAARTSAPLSSEVILLTVLQPPTRSNHKAGAIAFGQDGMLYIALGDGGSANDPDNFAQNLGSPLGKILRIRKDGSIPADNPFVGTAGARGEIWAYGMRNPYRMSFDAGTGLLWAGDVGQNAEEEIDIITRGGNYGWRIYEGNRSNINPDNRPASDFVAPVFTYTHDVGQSITGGVVYRGAAIPGLIGQYVYGDFVAATAWALNVENGRATRNLALGPVPGPTSFGEDLDGEIYITAFDGGIYKLVPGDVEPAQPFPRLLSETGLFQNTARLKPARGVIEYAPNAAFWSDGTRKRRWIAVPGKKKIRFSASGNWLFPDSTVTVKHFEITLADGSVKRLETRVFVLQDSGWNGYTYRWNEAGSDAVLLDGQAFTEFQVADATAPGGQRTQRYEFPSRAACLNCHTGAAGFVLGFITDQLNGPFTYPSGVTDNQLRTFNHIGYFNTDIGDPAQYPALPDPLGSAPLALRARAYLDSNCSQCHQPGGPTGVGMDLRASTPVAGMGTHGVPANTDLGVSDAQRIAPGDKARSTLWLRLQRLDGERMPPVASHVVDADGVALIGSWIDAGAQ